MTIKIKNFGLYCICMGKYYSLVALSGVLSGTIVFGGRIFANLGLSLFELATLPFIFILLFLLPFVVVKKEYHLKRSYLPLLILYGLVSAILVLSQFGSMILGVPISIVVLLLYTQPLWTILLSRIFTKEKLTHTNLVACLIVLVGIFFLVQPQGAEKISILGLLAGLLGGIMLSSWVVIGSIASKRGVHPITAKFSETLFMFPFLGLLYPIFISLVDDPLITGFRLNWPLWVWVWLIVFSVIAQIVNHLCYLKGVKRVPAVDAGILLLLEPISAAVLAVLFLNQQITANMLLGSIFILLANYLVIRKSQTAT